MERLLLFWIVVNFMGVFIVIAGFICNDIDCSFVNPKVVYKNIRVNWFGAWFLAIVANVLLPTMAIPYWIYKLCTVGRDK